MLHRLRRRPHSQHAVAARLQQKLPYRENLLIVFNTQNRLTRAHRRSFRPVFSGLSFLRYSSLVLTATALSPSVFAVIPLPFKYLLPAHALVEKRSQHRSHRRPACSAGTSACLAPFANRRKSTRLSRLLPQGFNSPEQSPKPAEASCEALRSQFCAGKNPPVTHPRSSRQTRRRSPNKQRSATPLHPKFSVKLGESFSRPGLTPQPRFRDSTRGNPPWQRRNYSENAASYP